MAKYEKHLALPGPSKRANYSPHKPQRPDQLPIDPSWFAHFSMQATWQQANDVACKTYESVRHGREICFGLLPEAY
jgi:hypothetical protein